MVNTALHYCGLVLRRRMSRWASTFDQPDRLSQEVGGQLLASLCSSCPRLRALTVSSHCSRASREPHIDVGDLPERLARLTRLSALAMEGCGISAASALGGCSALETLSLRGLQGQECSRQKDATRPAAWPPRLRALHCIACAVLKPCTHDSSAAITC